MAKELKKGFYYDNTVEITLKGKKYRVSKQVAEILKKNQGAK